MSRKSGNVVADALEAGEPQEKTVKELEKQIQDMEIALVDAERKGRHDGERVAAENYKKLIEKLRREKEQWRGKAKREERMRMEAESKIEKLMADVEQMAKKEAEKAKTMETGFLKFAEDLKKNYSSASQKTGTDEHAEVREGVPSVKRLKLISVPTSTARISAESPPAHPALLTEKEVQIEKARQELRDQTDQIFIGMNLAPQKASPIQSGSSPEVHPGRSEAAEEMEIEQEEEEQVGDDAPMDQMDEAAEQQHPQNPDAFEPFAYLTGVGIMENRLKNDVDAMRIYSDPTFGSGACLWNQHCERLATQVVRRVPTAYSLFHSWYSIQHPKTPKSVIGDIWRERERNNPVWKDNRDMLETEQRFQLSLNIIEVRADGRHRQE